VRTGRSDEPAIRINEYACAFFSLMMRSVQVCSGCKEADSRSSQW
jgi:hypothetical protein